MNYKNSVRCTDVLPVPQILEYNESVLILHAFLATACMVTAGSFESLLPQPHLYKVALETAPPESVH